VKIKPGCAYSFVAALVSALLFAGIIAGQFALDNNSCRARFASDSKQLGDCLSMSYQGVSWNGPIGLGFTLLVALIAYSVGKSRERNRSI